MPVNADTCELHPSIELDALYTGALTGRVPTSWSSDGWLLSLKNRMSRTDCPEMIERFRCEIESIKAEIEAKQARP